MKRRPAFTVFFHVLGWCLFLLAPAILSPGPLFHKVTSTEMVSLAIRSITLMIYFYGNLFYITPVVLKRKGPVVFAIVSIVLIVVISNVNSIVHHFYVDSRMHPPPMFDSFDGPPPRRFPPPGELPPMMFASPTFSSLLITTLVGIISSMLVFWQEWDKVQAEKQEQALQRVAAELTALKLQISPHFLFNTLNNIRWLVRTKSEAADEAVVKLSHLLRYILYQTDKDKVDLDQELNHLRDFVELQQMRIEDQKAIEFATDGEVTGKKIVPLLLLPLAENFFKHGDFTKDYRNRIAVSIKEWSLVFKTENKILESPGSEHGLGLANVVKRLKLHYPDRHILTHTEKEGVFYLQLELLLS